MLNDDYMDAVFQALAHASRRLMLDKVKQSPGIGVGALASGFDVSRIAVMKHLAMIEAAGLIISEKQGRVRKLYFNVAPIQMIHDRWTDEYSQYWAGHLTGIKYRAENAQRRKTSKKKAKDRT